MTNKENRLLSAIKNERGSSLVVVIVAFAVLIITATALAGIVFFNHKNAMDYHKKQQAEYTARGAMQAIEQAFINPSVGGGQAMIDAVVAAGSTGITGTGDISSVDMGKYNVSLKLISEDIIHAEVIATYRSISYKLSAYFEQESGGSDMNPHNFLIFSPTKMNIPAHPAGKETMFNGNVFSYNGLKADGATFNGKVLTLGTDFNLRNCKFLAPFVLRGTMNIIAADNNTFSKIYAEGNVTGAPFEVVTTGIGFENAINSHLRNWGAIAYNFIHPDKILINGITFTMYGSSVGLVKLKDGTEFDIRYTGFTHTDGTTYNHLTKVLTIPTDNGDDKCDLGNSTYTTADGYGVDFSSERNPVYTNPPITGSTGLTGTISAGAYKVLGNSNAGDVVFNTSGGDVELHFKSDYAVSGTMSITGDNNVYMYLDGHKLTINNSTIGENDSDKGAKHQLFVVGTGSQVKINDSKFKGCIYLNGAGSEYSDSNATTSEEHFKGSITAEKVSISPGNTYTFSKFFKEPKFDATIFDPDGRSEYFIYPKSDGSGGTWTLLNYAK